jgi:hypothetical protein
MVLKLNTRVRLQKWIKVPVGTVKNGTVVKVNAPGASEPLYTVTLDNGMLCIRLWESDLIVIH